MIKTLMLASMLTNSPVEEIRPDNEKKIKAIAISATFIVVANLLVYSPIIMANANKGE